MSASRFLKVSLKFIDACNVSVKSVQLNRVILQCWNREIRTRSCMHPGGLRVRQIHRMVNVANVTLSAQFIMYKACTRFLVTCKYLHKCGEYTKVKSYKISKKFVVRINDGVIPPSIFTFARLVQS